MNAPLHQPRGQLYRIDKFKVPGPARDEFMQNVCITHELLKTLPGFVQDLILEQTSGPGVFNIVTIAVWENAAVVEAAKQVVAAKRAELGFNPQDLLDRLGIEADMATYIQTGARPYETR